MNRKVLGWEVFDYIYLIRVRVNVMNLGRPVVSQELLFMKFDHDVNSF